MARVHLFIIQMLIAEKAARNPLKPKDGNGKVVRPKSTITRILTYDVYGNDVDKDLLSIPSGDHKYKTCQNLLIAIHVFLKDSRWKARVEGQPGTTWIEIYGAFDCLGYGIDYCNLKGDRANSRPNDLRTTQRARSWQIHWGKNRRTRPAFTPAFATQRASLGTELDAFKKLLKYLVKICGNENLNEIFTQGDSSMNHRLKTIGITGHVPEIHGHLVLDCRQAAIGSGGFFKVRNGTPAKAATQYSKMCDKAISNQCDGEHHKKYDNPKNTDIFFADPAEENPGKSITYKDDNDDASNTKLNSYGIEKTTKLTDDQWDFIEAKRKAALESLMIFGEQRAIFAPTTTTLQ